MHRIHTQQPVRALNTHIAWQRQPLPGESINQVLWILTPTQIEYQRPAAHTSFAVRTVNVQAKCVAVTDHFINGRTGPDFYSVALHDVV